MQPTLAGTEKTAARKQTRIPQALHNAAAY